MAINPSKGVGIMFVVYACDALTCTSKIIKCQLMLTFNNHLWKENVIEWGCAFKYVLWYLALLCFYICLCALQAVHLRESNDRAYGPYEMRNWYESILCISVLHGCVLELASTAAVFTTIELFLTMTCWSISSSMHLSCNVKCNKGQ